METENKFKDYKHAEINDLFFIQDDKKMISICSVTKINRFDIEYKVIAGKNTNIRLTRSIWSGSARFPKERKTFFPMIFQKTKWI